MMSSGFRRNISATASRLTMSLSRTRRYFSGSSNMMSIVSQNGPAFFERTSTARSAIVAAEAAAVSVISDLLVFGAEQACRTVRHEDVVQVELVDRAAVEFGRRVREGDAGNQPVPFRDRVVDREMRYAGSDRARQFLAFGNHVPDDKHLVAARLALGFERPHDAVAAIDPGHDLVGTVADRRGDPYPDIVVELFEPAVEFGDDVGIAHTAHQDRRIPALAHAFELDRV